MALTSEQQKKVDGYFKKPTDTQGAASKTVGDYLKQVSSGSNTNSRPPVSSDFISNLKSKLSNRGSQIAGGIKGAVNDTQNPVSNALQVVGGVAGGIKDVAVEGAKAGFKTIAPEAYEGTKDFAEGVQKSVGNFVQESPTAMSAITKLNRLAAEHPEAARNIGAASDIADVLGAGAAGKQALNLATTAGKLATKGAADLVGSTADNLAKKTTAIKDVFGKTKDFITTKGAEITDAAKGAAERMPINVAEKKAQQTVLAELPEQGQKAVRGGILPRDVQLVTAANPKEKSIFKSMVDAAKRYESDRGATDPASFVGNEMRKRIDSLEKVRKSTGEELGEFAAQIPKGKFLGAREQIIASLKKIPGLEDIKVSKGGALDFSQTTLAGSLTSADRKVIQKAFSDTARKSASALHKQRQEIFEVLGGKKRAMSEITETQEKALEAIRQGAAEAIEEVSPRYKALNQKYAKVAEPLKEMRKFFKNVAGADEDILDMRASQLARRLTSNSASGPEIKSILRSMESELVENGIQSETSIETLQDFYNAVSRYYDVTKDTSLAGQISLGAPELSGSGLTMRAIQEATKEMGVTPATMKRAFEGLLD